MALARPGGRAPGLPLARSPRERDRLGREPDRASRDSPAGRSRRARGDGGGAAATGQLPPRVRPRGGASLLVRGARILDARSPRGGQASDRRTPLWPYGSTALPIPTSLLPLLRRPSRSSPTMRSPSRTSSPARFRHRTGRVCCSTHTRRGMERSEGRSRRSRVPIAAATRPGLRAAVATRASASRFSSRHSSREPSRRRTRASPPTRAAMRSSRAVQWSDFGRDPVVGAAEDHAPSSERDARGGDACRSCPPAPGASP